MTLHPARRSVMRAGLRRPNPRLLMGVAVALSILVCLLLGWLGWRHGTEHREVFDRLEEFRLARIDLNEGFLQLALGGSSGGPLDREEGLVLLRQAVAAIEKNLAGQQHLPAGLADSFRRDMEEFERALTVWREMGYAHPGRAAEVRIAFAQLDRAADTLDRLIGEALRQLNARTDRLLAWAAGLASLLLAGICLVVVRSIRAAESSERALRTSEERFREISASFTDIVYSCRRNVDGSHAVEWITGGIERILGYRAEEIRSLGCWGTLVLEEDRERFAAGVAGLAPGADGRCDLRLRRRDGAVAWLASYCRCVAPREPGGQVRLFGALVDIGERKLMEEKARASEAETQRLLAQADSARRALLSVVEDQKRTEAALAESLDRYQLANRVTFDVLWDWNIATGAVARNPNFQSVFGWDPAELGPGIESWLDRVHPEDRARVQDSLFAALESDRDTWSDHYRFLRRDGQYADVDDRVSISRDPEGLPVRVIGAMQDITERRRSEEELRRLSMAVEQSSAIVVITDAEGRIEYVNPRFTTVTGYAPEEVRGRGAGFIGMGDRSDEEHGIIWDTISAGREWHGEFHNRRKDGTAYWEQATIAPMRNALGAITHYIAVKEDITAHKGLEAQLLQAQKMESVGRLAGGVAHDFNNMLQVIDSYTELAMMKIDAADPVHQYLQQIREAARRSADLTRQLLAFARKQTVSPRVLDLNETVAGMLKMLRRLIGEDIDLAWMPGMDLWSVTIDPSQVDQILANLAVNARDAIAGTGKLTIETRNVVRDRAYCVRHAGCVPGEYVMLAVRDDGCGMSREVMAHLFEPFFTTKGVGKGTGLGTATVYGIVRQNNGFIDVESEPEKGTTFRIHLPRAGAAGGAPVERAGPAELPRGTETVLLVEDEAAILDLGRRMLEELGYTVLAAPSPAEAIRLADARQGPFDLLITDVVMPEMNGRELEAAIAARRGGVRCLFMSGYTADIIARQGVLEDGLRFLQKPFSMEQLARRVRDALDGSPRPFAAARGG